LGAYGNWVGTKGFSFLLTAFLRFPYMRERESPPQLYVHLFTHSPTPCISTILSRKGFHSVVASPLSLKELQGLVVMVGGLVDTKLVIIMVSNNCTQIPFFLDMAIKA
jgi:hypothetical protein